MWESRRKMAWKPSRVFQPAVDGRLEDRVLLSSAQAANQQQITLPPLAQAPEPAERLTPQQTTPICGFAAFKGTCAEGPA